MKTSKYVRTSFSIIFLLLLLSSSVLLVVQRQAALDWLILRNYEPSTAISRLSIDASMSDFGRKLFYIHDPSLLTKQEFSGKCSNDEVTIVLGCYISNSKIYVFDVTEERLDGVEEVTAAHEMLHAAFDRLNDTEKNRITNLLETTFASSTDERLKSTVENYRKKDPAIVPNELHSILGTEVRELPKELEEYYSKYFLNRLDVVTKAEAYESEFTGREDRIAAYDAQLNELKLVIDQKQNNIVQLSSALATENKLLEQKKSNPAAYNAAIPSYNALVRQYNTEIQDLRVVIEKFNTLVEERNAIAIEERELVEAIDTRATEL